jgi:hypothetical protein
VVRFLITISRTWRDWDAVEGPLRDVLAWDPGAVMVSGACPRGDADVEKIWAYLLGMTRDQAVRAGRIEQHPARWETGMDAGFRRNTEMAFSGVAGCLAWIHGRSHGASHCAAEAERAGVPVRRYTA